MSYPYPGAYTFMNTEFKDPEVPFGVRAPVRCPEHPDYCFRCEMAWTDLSNSFGVWRLRVPINVPTFMPGVNQRLLSLSIDGLYKLGSGTWITEQYNDIAILGDGAVVYEYKGLSKENNKWINNPLNVNLDISRITSLDLVLTQGVWVLSGYYGIHDANITISYIYYSDVPPSTGSVEVRIRDMDTLAPLSGFLVRLMMGTEVIASGTTDANGVVSWANVQEGSYTLKVYGYPATYWSKGYSDLTKAVTVVPDTLNSFEVNLASIPVISIPWYVWAGVGVGGVLIAYSALKPRYMPSVPSIIMMPIERLRKKGEE